MTTRDFADELLPLVRTASQGKVGFVARFALSSFLIQIIVEVVIALLRKRFAEEKASVVSFSGVNAGVDSPYSNLITSAPLELVSVA